MSSYLAHKRKGFQGAAPLAFDGFGNRSRSFDGVDDYIDIPDLTATIGTSYTVSAWAKISDLTQADGVAIFDAADSISSYFSILFRCFYVKADGNIKFQIRDASGTTNIVTQSWTSTNTWHHFVLVRSGSNITAYIDGVSIGSDNSSVIGSHTAGHYVTLGNLRNALLPTNAPYFMNGKIADVRIYDTDLTATDISDLYNGTNITTNLVGHWLTDADNVLDAAGTNHGTNYGTKYSYDNPSPPVEFGRASRSFDGLNDEVNLGDPDDLSFDNVVNDSPFSISLWFKSNLPIGNTQTLVAKATASSAVEYLMNLSVSGKITLTLHQNNAGFGTYLDTHSASAYTKDKWHHAVVTYDGSILATGIKVYFDGVDDTGFYGSGGTYSGQTNTTAELIIGNRNTSSGQEMSGNLADVRIYDTDLTASQVSDLYAGTDVQTNLVGHWLTDNDDVEDKAGTNDGTNFGSTYSYDNPPMDLIPSRQASRVFNGTSDYIDCGDILDSVWNGAGKKFTFATWIKTDALDDGIMMSKLAGTSNGRTWYVRVRTNGELGVLLYENGTSGSDRFGRETSTSGSISAGVWTHCAFVYDQTAGAGNFLKMYIDGVESTTLVDYLSSGSFTGILIDNATPVQISGFGNGILPFGGNLADMRIYDTNLTASQILAIYNGTTDRTNLVGQWLTNSDDVLDHAGTNDGTNNGSTYSTDSPS